MKSGGLTPNRSEAKEMKSLGTLQLYTKKIISDIIQMNSKASILNGSANAP